MEGVERSTGTLTRGTFRDKVFSMVLAGCSDDRAFSQTSSAARFATFERDKVCVEVCLAPEEEEERKSSEREEGGNRKGAFPRGSVISPGISRTECRSVRLDTVL